MVELTVRKKDYISVILLFSSGEERIRTADLLTDS